MAEQTQLIESSNKRPEFIGGKLSQGAKLQLAKFDDGERQCIVKAKPMTKEQAEDWVAVFDAMDPPTNLQFAQLYAGLEKGKVGEAIVAAIEARIHAKWPRLKASFLSNIRKVADHLISTEKRKELIGNDHNVVDQDDHVDQVNYAASTFLCGNEILPTVFWQGDQMVEVIEVGDGLPPKIVPVSQARFSALLNCVVQFRKMLGETFIGVPVPSEVVSFLFNYRALALPELKGISPIPFYDKSGRLVLRSGFDYKTGIMVCLGDLDVPRVPTNITKDDVHRALEYLARCFCDFELDGVARPQFLSAALNEPNSQLPTASFLNLIGFLLEQFVRPMIDGPVMPHLISKTTPGAGGGLLVQAVQEIVVGKPDTRPLSRSEDEKRKAVMSALLRGTSLIAWDNITGDVDSPVLASLFTEPYFTDRGLGGNKEYSPRVTCSFVMVGNRPLLSGELQRRMSLIELKPQTAHPEQRSGFLYPNLMQHIRANRGQIIWALLVLVRNWIQQGRPSPKCAPVIGSYESYTAVVGGIIEAASPNWTSWQGNRKALAEIASDGDDLEIVELLEVWCAEGQLEISSTDLAKLAENHQVALPVKTVLGEPFVYNVRSLGKYMAQFSGRLFKLGSDVTVEFAKSTKKGASNYPWVLSCKEAA